MTFSNMSRTELIEANRELVTVLEQIKQMASRRFSASSAGLKETDDNLNHIMVKCQIKITKYGEGEKI